MNKKIRRANSFHSGFRRHSTKISHIHIYTHIYMYQCRRSNNPRCFTTIRRQDIAQTCRRRDDDISRRHNTGMTCAEFVARHEFASNEQRRSIAAPTGLPFSRSQCYYTRRNRLRGYFACSRLCFEVDPHFERVTRCAFLSCQSFGRSGPRVTGRYCAV